MAQESRFELVSFDICPYVQRSVITLLHKKVDFKLTFIDLEKPPEWFEKRSPLGKVPLLFVREPGKSEPTTLFESAVINEYVDEVTPPAIAAKDPLKRAFERAWVEVGGELLGAMFTAAMTDDAAEAKESLQEMWSTFSRLEEVLPGGTNFRGQEFSLVDAAFAPLFMRMMMFRPLVEASEWKALPKTRRWADHLLGLGEVRESVIPEFKQKFAGYLQKRGSHWASQVIAS